MELNALNGVYISKGKRDMKAHRMRVCIDFDGVIHDYSEGYKDGSLYGKPIEGAIENIVKFHDAGHGVYILTARDKEQHKTVETWIRKYLPDSHKDIPITVSNTKPPAGAYIDDKAVAFRNWDQAMEDVINQIDKEMKRKN